MDTLQLTPEVIAYARKEVDLKSLLKPAEKVTANHILYQQFIEGTKWKGLPKVIFYIIIEQEFGSAMGKDEKGLLGYKLQLINS